MTARIADDVLEKIRELHAQGLGTTATAERLQISLSAAHNYKKAMGLLGLVALPEKEILKLLRKGARPKAISKCLKVSYRRTQKFAWANGFGRPRPKLSAAQKKLLTAGILKREASAWALAKKYGACYNAVLKMAHELLACERFLPSWRTPLSSYLPAKYFDAKMGQRQSPPVSKRKKMDHANLIQENCLHIIDAAVRTLDGKMPPKEILVAVLASRFAPEKPDAEFFLLPPAVYARARKDFIASLSLAVDIFTRDRATQFLN